MLNRRAIKPGRVTAIVLVVFVTLGVLPLGSVASASSGATAIVTNAYYLNVRGGPGVGYGVVTVLARGTYVTMLGRNANASWVKIQPIDGFYWQGWVNAYYLAPSMSIWDLPIVDGTPPPPPPPPPGAIGTVTNAYSLNMRTGPGVGYGIITTLSYGTQVNLVGRNAAATWVQIETPGGPVIPVYRGWVNASYIATSYPIYNLPVTDGTQPPPGQRVHVVQRSETLYRIARYYGSTVQAIAAANGIANPNLIYVGQRLVIP